MTSKTSAVEHVDDSKSKSNSASTIVFSGVLFWALATLASVLFVSSHVGTTLIWDEVDYVNAARKGFVENASDSSAMRADDLLRFIYGKFRKTEIALKSPHDEASDVFLLRHFHPPMLQYALLSLGQDRLNPGHETDQRTVQLAAGSILIAMMIFGYVLLAAESATIAGVFNTAVAGSVCCAIFGQYLQSHLWLSIGLLPTCIFLHKFLAQPSRKHAMLLGAILGFDFLCLETGLFVAFFAISAGLVRVLFFPPSEQGEPAISPQPGRSALGDCIRYALATLLTMVLVMILTYPGAILRLSILRIFSIYAYRIMLGEEYAGAGGNFASLLLRTGPVAFLSLAGVSLAVVSRGFRSNTLRISFLVIGAGYTLIISRFLLNVTYIVPGLSVLAVLGAAGLSRKLKRSQEIGVSAVLVAVTWFSAPSLLTPIRTLNAGQMQEVVKIIGDRKAYLTGAHILEYYHPEMRSRIVPILFGDNGSTLTVRDPVTYRTEPLSDEDLADSVVLIGVMSDQPRISWESNLPKHGQRLEMPHLPGRVYRFSAPGSPSPE